MHKLQCRLPRVSVSLKHVIKIEENICSTNNEKLKFDKFNIIYENL